MPTGIYKRTEFHRKRLKEGAINSVNSGRFKKGQKPSQDTIRKLSLIRTGHITSEETRKKISEAQKGRKLTNDHKLKLSKARLGKKPWNTGIKGSIKAWNKGIKYLAITGNKNNRWKGGVTPQNHKIRTSIEMKLWKKSCLERDNFTCQKTKIRGGKLVIHHINNFADFPELRTAINNGITLSETAHKMFHKLYGTKNNTKEQLEDFLKNK